MPPGSAIVWTSSLSVFSDKKDYISNSHFTWQSIKAFLYIASVFSSTIYNFDIFSRIARPVRIYEFVICQIMIGMPYMVMDGFIRQYTGKIDCNSNLNPLLKGITYGNFLQTSLWALIHAGYLADSIRYLVSSLRPEPSWAKCQTNSTCVSSQNVMIRCRNKNMTAFTSTSAHFNYLKSFSHLDRNVLTTRFFVIALVWIFNFYLATIHDDAFLKLFKITCIWRVLSTFIAIIFVISSNQSEPKIAFLKMLDINTPYSYIWAVDHITHTYGVGFLGFYDFQSTSPYTMIDNAVVLFSISLTGFALLRSWIIRNLYAVLRACVLVEFRLTPHYLIFAVLPLSTEFLYAHKLYIFYIYINTTVATMMYLCMVTHTMSKFLHNEFKSVKNVYFVGILCCVGFIFSVPINVSMTTSTRVMGLVAGMKIIVLYLGGFKVAIIMWIYGVKRFSTDIHFWLGFKPTKFWILSWMVMPIILMLFLLTRIYNLTHSDTSTFIIAAMCWIVLSLLVVHYIQFKTLAKYIVHNNLAGAFSSGARYGPPDPDDRKRRMNYDETMRLRQCKHNCTVLDEHYDCNHLPLITKRNPSRESTTSSRESMTNIFQAGTSSRVKDIPSSVLIIHDSS